MEGDRSLLVLPADEPGIEVAEPEDRALGTGPEPLSEGRLSESRSPLPGARVCGWERGWG